MTFAMPMAVFPALAEQLGGTATVGFLYSAMSVGALARHAVQRVDERRATPRRGDRGRSRRLGPRDLRARLRALVAGRGGLSRARGRRGHGQRPVPDDPLERDDSADAARPHGEHRAALVHDGPLLGNVRAGFMAERFGLARSIAWGGLLCVAGVVLCIPRCPRSGVTADPSPRARRRGRSRADRKRISPAETRAMLEPARWRRSRAPRRFVTVDTANFGADLYPPETMLKPLRSAARLALIGRAIARARGLRDLPAGLARAARTRARRDGDAGRGCAAAAAAAAAEADARAASEAAAGARRRRSVPGRLGRISRGRCEDPRAATVRSLSRGARRAARARFSRSARAAVALRPAAAIAVGREAVDFARAHLASTPLVFCQVFNYQELFESGRQIWGVQPLPPLALQLRGWSTVDPSRKRIGMIVSEAQKSLVSEARAVAAPPSRSRPRCRLRIATRCISSNGSCRRSMASGYFPTTRS